MTRGGKRWAPLVFT